MATIAACAFCEMPVPQLGVHSGALGAVIRALEASSRTIASSELRHLIGCSDEEAASWVAHLLSCAPAWPLSSQDEEVLQRVTSAFEAVERPSTFTDVSHCDECREHDKTLQARAPQRLRRKDLGNPGWDPVTFCAPQAMGYLFPSLARFALLSDVWRNNTWYGCQLLGHLSYGARNNGFYQWCSTGQRRAVAVLLAHLARTRIEAISSTGCKTELSTALDVWGSDT